MNSRATPRNARARLDLLDEGRRAFQRRAWSDAFSQLGAADSQSLLEPEDLVQLAQAALLIGREAEGAEVLARAHHAFQTRGDVRQAAWCGFRLGFTLLLNGEVAKAGGWLSRTNRLLDTQADCVEKGYLLLPEGYRTVHAGDASAAHAIFVRATAIGERFKDTDLTVLGLQAQGRCLIRQGEVTRGVALLDEAMVAVTADEVSPLNAGGVYCSVLEACGEIFDLKRAQEWTSALEKWCASQPDLVPYRGDCLVRRAEILQLHGAWPEALEWAERACELLSRPTSKPAVGAAYYQISELQRLRGKFAEAEEAYRHASEWHPNPGPGLAQLRFAQGHVEAASAAIRRLAEEVREPGLRARVLDAYVEIVLASNDVSAAGAAADELKEIAARRDVPFLQALASRASGAVLLARGDAQHSLVELRRSWRIWCDLDAPYEAARTRVLIGLACRELGDEENARLEITAARQVLQRLRATPDLVRLNALLPHDTLRSAGPLTGREAQVLKLVASGLTNRTIARKLNISEKTVARHLSNIFTKLDVSSRTAAAAYAYDHKLV